MSGVTFYTGIGGEKTWNHHPIAPGPYACISPVRNKKVTLKDAHGQIVLDENGNPVKVDKATNNYIGAFDKSVRVIQDSGAFTDPWEDRYTDFGDALDRQEKHAKRYSYADQIEARATYDLLIDEVWFEGNRFKRRWSVLDAEAAVDTTVAAAQFLNDHRNGIPLVVSAQGVNADQYLRCTQRLMPYFQQGDIFGLGGWCIIGKMPAVMMPVFRETVTTVIPFLAREGVERVHIWGVVYPPALGVLLWECDQYGMRVSTDSVGPTLSPTRGQWGHGKVREGGWWHRIQKPPLEIIGLERARHVRETRTWLDALSQTAYYKSADMSPAQKGQRKKPVKRSVAQRSFLW